MSPEGFNPPHGKYRELPAFQEAEVAYQIASVYGEFPEERN
jgi:hypothetical protein